MFVNHTTGSMGRFLRYYRYGYRIGPAHLDDIQCTGNEQRLVDCLKMSRPNQNCTSHRYLKPYSVCQPGTYSRDSIIIVTCMILNVNQS